MIIATVKYSVTDREAVLAIARPYSAAARQAHGNIEHMIMPTYEDNQLYAVEIWENMEDLKAFGATETAKLFKACREPYYLENTRETVIYQADRAQ